MIEDGALILGACLISIGLGLFFFPAGVVAAGVFLVAYGLLAGNAEKA